MQKAPSYFWVTCLWLIFETGVLCDGKIVKRQYYEEPQLEGSCIVDSFTCSNGKCIESSAVCDGFANCLDASDETQSLCFRMFPTCPSFSFRCKYGACVDKSSKCDGKPDCVDGSDENLPECSVTSQQTTVPTHSISSVPLCKAEEYKCRSSSECIDATAICDGTADCIDGSDETMSLCKSAQCQTYMFKCRYGACISKSDRCNGQKNCADGSDEEGCPSMGIVTPSFPVRPATVKPKPNPTTPPTVTNSNNNNNRRKTCILPTTMGNLYSLQSDPNTILPQGSAVDESTVVELNCEEGYYKSSQIVLTMVCLQTGKWSYTYSNVCLKRCPPKTSDNLDMTCNFNGNIVDCSKPSVPGTKLKPKCKSTHNLQNGQRETPIELKCHDSGSWIGPELYTCQPKCGIVFAKTTTLIVNGTKSDYGSAPWNVGIYKQGDNKEYDMICGGSLISTNLIISAAHCFWDDSLRERTITNINGHYKIAVGKYTRDYRTRDNRYTDFIDLQIVHLHDTYNGLSGSYAEDIAIIVLQTKITVSVVVAPVCMHWETNTKYFIPNGARGKVVGWGHTENNVPSSILLEAFLPYIDRKNCLDKFSPDFQRYLTTDKFCAGAVTGIGGVHSGDSGAGLTFEHSNSHFITGIVSSKDQSTNNSIGIFTDVRYHIEWITQLYLNYNPDYNYSENRMLSKPKK